jgi:ankyrin repeat protein
VQDLVWLSQYPHEKEILFPPLMALEILSRRVHDNRLYVSVRPSVNLNSLTIEPVVAKMQRSHLQLLDMLSDGLRFAGVPARAMQSLTALKSSAEQREPAWFNFTTNYLNATEQALNEQAKVFRSLALPDSCIARPPGCPPQPACPSHRYLADPVNEKKVFEKMEGDSLKESARLAAQAGMQKHAVGLLLLRHKKKNCTHKCQDTVEALERIVNELLDEGCDVPWPATMVELCSQQTNGRKDACLSEEKTLNIVQASLEKRVNPFGPGARVLITEEQEQPSWRYARIIQKYQPESQEFLERGVTWQVKLPGAGKLELPESAVLAPSRGGLSAVLRVAAEMGDSYLVELLVAKSSFNLYETDESANSALIIAARYRKHQVCRILLKAPQAEQAPSEISAQTEKLAHGHKQPVGFKGLRNTMRQNAYDLAVTKTTVDSYQTVRVILPSTSDKLFTSLESKLPIAVQNDTDGSRGKLAEMLNCGGQTMKELKDKVWDDAGSGVTTLMLACRLGNKEAVDELIAASADVSAQTAGDDDPCTALGMASEQGHDSIVKALLQAKADPNQLWEKPTNTPTDKKRKKRMAILLAAQGGRENVVAELIKAKADVNASRDGRTVLMHACQYGYKDTAEQLLDAKADIDQKNSHGETALMFASRYGQINVVRLLLKRGINVNEAEIATPTWGSLHRACANGFVEVADALLDEYPKLIDLHASTQSSSVTPLMAAASADHHAIIHKLMRHNADATKVNREGQNAAWVAAKNAQHKALKALTAALGNTCRSVIDQFAPPLLKQDPVERNATGDCEPQYKQHTTPLMIATILGHAEAVQVLLFAKASTDLVSPKDKGQLEHDEMPFTALELAAATGNDTIIKQLIAHGAKSVEKARKIAAHKGYTETILAKQIGKGDGDKRHLPHEAFKKANSFKVDPFFDKDRMEETTKTLTWNRKVAFAGQIVPPRPSLAQIEAQESPLGKVTSHRGVVLQRGPFNGIFIRVGCVPRHPWIDLWQTLRHLVNYYLNSEREALAKNKDELENGTTDKKYVPAALYVVVSLRSMQAIDFSWLVAQGFHFHHYRGARDLRLHARTRCPICSFP